MTAAMAMNQVNRLKMTPTLPWSWLSEMTVEEK
jgi:hypothetical protein